MSFVCILIDLVVRIVGCIINTAASINPKKTSIPFLYAKHPTAVFTQSLLSNNVLDYCRSVELRKTTSLSTSVVDLVPFLISNNNDSTAILPISA